MRKTTILSLSRPATPVPEAPTVTVRQWAVYQLPCGNRHCCGWLEQRGRCRVSSPIVAVYAASASATTASGRRYRLLGPPAATPHGRAFWRAWLCASSTLTRDDLVDVTAEIWAAICSSRAAAAARWIGQTSLRGWTR